MLECSTHWCHRVFAQTAYQADQRPVPYPCPIPCRPVSSTRLHARFFRWCTEPQQSDDGSSSQFYGAKAQIIRYLGKVNAAGCQWNKKSHHGSVNRKARDLTSLCSPVQSDPQVVDNSLQARSIPVAKERLQNQTASLQNRAAKPRPLCALLFCLVPSEMWASVGKQLYVDDGRGYENSHRQLLLLIDRFDMDRQVRMVGNICSP